MTHEIFISELEAYCESMNQKPSTVCVRALGNSRFVDRMRRRAEKTQTDIRKVCDYMAANPPASDQSQSGEAA